MIPSLFLNLLLVRSSLSSKSKLTGSRTAEGLPSVGTSMVRQSRSTETETRGSRAMDARDEKRIAELEREIDSLKQEFSDYVKRKQEDESRKLRMALVWAGAVIVALGTFIWSEILWPILKSGAAK
jgi:hypothetical protein